MNMRSLLVTLSALVALLGGLPGCSSGEAPASAAPPPPPPLPGQVPGAPPVPAAPAMPQQINNPMQALQALGALGQQAEQMLGQQAGQAELGPVVNWRDLSAFLPESLGDLKASGEIDGETTSMQGLQVTTVKRRYKNGETGARVELVDTSLAPFLRAPFAMVQLIQEDSSRGYKRGTQVKGQPAIAQWEEKQKRSEVHILAAGRFLVNVELDDAKQGQAEGLAEALDLAGIIASAAKAKAQPGAAPAPSP
ncbi:MAG: hypothetical protein QM778_24440 [Myxococcales bacterium]